MSCIEIDTTDTVWGPDSDYIGCMQHVLSSQAIKCLFGLVLALLIGLFPLSQFTSPSLASLQSLAVQLDGRKKPLDTVARETVMKIHGATRYHSGDGEVLDEQQAFLALWFNDRDWNQEPFILCSYRPLKQQLGLDLEQNYFSFETLINSGVADIITQARQRQRRNQDLSRDQREALSLGERLDLVWDTVGAEDLPLVPHPSDPKGKWVGLSEASLYYSADQVAPLAAHFERLQQAYRSELSNLSTVGKLADHWHQGLASLSPTVYPPDHVLQREVFFNHIHFFAKAWRLYAIAFVMMLLALWVPSWELDWAAIGIFTAGIGLQGAGFLLRMQVAGRPPVTNMYESVVWVGFGIAVLAWLFELQSRSRIYLLAAAPLSILCLVLADRLPAVLDPSIDPLVPVLRDNFWLSIHVPTITLGYASFALAMGLGHVGLGYYLFAPQAQQRIQTLARFNYQVLQVGVLLLTTGIILGGIWAHFSWGRFWGWDPKETWALIALLCYLAPLHGRLVGWIGSFGLTVASVVSFNAVLMAWYGVNFVLGTGLHSYGFSTGSSELIVSTVVGLDLLFVLLVVIQHRRTLTDLALPSLDSSICETPHGLTHH